MQNLKERNARLTAEHQRLRMANEDDESLYKVILDEIIHIDDPTYYRSMIKNFKEAFAAGKDIKERLQGLMAEADQATKEAVKEEKPSFKPYLYSNQYRGKVQSVIKTQLDHSKAAKLATGGASDPNLATTNQDPAYFGNLSETTSMQGMAVPMTSSPLEYGVKAFASQAS